MAVTSPGPAAVVLAIAWASMGNPVKVSKYFIMDMNRCKIVYFGTYLLKKPYLKIPCLKLLLYFFSKCEPLEDFFIFLSLSLRLAQILESTMLKTTLTLP